MVAVLIGRIQEFVGISTDTKPTAPPVGSTFRETDTGLTAIYDGAAWRGADEVRSARKVAATPSTTRVTIATPATGKKIRIISVSSVSVTTTSALFETYFGTGANIDTDTSKAIFAPLLDITDQPSHSLSWPDGGGPIGAIDEVVSLRTSVDVASNGSVIIHFREE